MHQAKRNQSQEEPDRSPPLNSLKSTGEVALQREISAVKQNQSTQNIQKSTAPPREGKKQGTNNSGKT
jgi:hypothetical protein